MHTITHVWTLYDSYNNLGLCSHLRPTLSGVCFRRSGRFVGMLRICKGFTQGQPGTVAFDIVCEASSLPIQISGAGSCMSCPRGAGWALVSAGSLGKCWAQSRNIDWVIRRERWMIKWPRRFRGPNVLSLH